MQPRMDTDEHGCGVGNSWLGAGEDVVGLGGGDGGLDGVYLTTEFAVAVCKEPGGDHNRDTRQDQEFMSDDDGWQDDKGQAAECDEGAGGDATDDGAEGWPGKRGDTKDEKGEAGPDNRFKAGELGAEFAGGVFLGGAEFGGGVDVLGIGNQNSCRW